jgi:DNA-binding NtrC family response regulator
MSRNAIALKPSVSKRPVQPFPSVAQARTGHNAPEETKASERLRALKELIFSLLGEVQALEQDELLAELTTPHEFRKLDIEKGIRFDDVVRQFEMNIIRQALLLTGGNQARAARLLGIKPNTLNYKIKLYNLI